MKIAVVTTFSPEGWAQYAHRMVASFDLYWPREVDLFVYLDKDVALMGPKAGRARVFLHDDTPGLRKFKTKHDAPVYHGRAGGRYDYRMDVVKFCHKPFAVWDFLCNRNCVLGYDKVIWMDADTITHRDVPLDVVETKMCLPGVDFLYLGRDHKYSECGFMVFDGGEPAMDYMTEVIRFYAKGRFRYENEWHDSFLFDRARTKLEAKNHLKAHNLTAGLNRTNGGGHPFNTSFLGLYMSHQKGKRKVRGDRPTDNPAGHDTPYWNSLTKGARP